MKPDGIDLNQVEDLLEQIGPGREEFINRRIRHITFAKVVFWLCMKGLKEDFVCSSDLAKFLKVSNTRAYMILNDLCQVGIMWKRFVTSNFVEFWMKVNETTGEKIINEYYSRAKNTLGIKFELKVKMEEKSL